MARQVRKTPIALSEPLQVLNVNTITAGIVVFILFLLSRWIGWRLALLFAGTIYGVGRYAEAKDPRYFNTLRIALFKFRSVYDPVARKHFEVRIVDDEA